MRLVEEMIRYIPLNEQEETDQRVMLQYIKESEDVLTRKNEVAHFTASGWIVNKERTKVLMIYHTLFNSWSWTGGHADGEENLLKVAIKEAMEETGVASIQSVKDDIFSLEIIPVEGHMKNGVYVSSHLHMNITYLLVADETEAVKIKPDENSDVRWMGREEAVLMSSEPWMRGIYQKLNERVATDIFS